MVFVTGDMHGDLTRYKDKGIKRLKKNDYLIICGDFGFVWNNSSEELKARKKIASKKFTTLFLEGLNENFELLESFPEAQFCGGRARKIDENIYMLRFGEIYNISGKSFFCLSGGDPDDGEDYSQNIRITPEEITAAVKNLENSEMKVDYILSHDAPASLKEFLGVEEIAFGYLSELLDKIMKTAEYGRWFFARYHTDKPISKKLCSVFKEVHPLIDTYEGKKKYTK